MRSCGRGPIWHGRRWRRSGARVRRCSATETGRTCSRPSALGRTSPRSRPSAPPTPSARASRSFNRCSSRSSARVVRADDAGRDRLGMSEIERTAPSALEQGQPVWEYADAPESTDIVKLEDRYRLFVGGEFVEPKSGTYFTTIDPATEEPLAEIAEAGPEDVDLAGTAAASGYGA